MAIKDFFGGKWFRRRHVFICLVLLVYTDLSNADLPSFTSTCQAYITVAEDTNNGTVLFQVTVTNSDTNEEMKITQNSITKTYTNITATTGKGQLSFNVTLRHNLDLDTDKSPIPLRFFATDPNGNQGTLKCDMYISDVNNKRPVFQNIPYTWELRENTQTSTTYKSILATDADQGSNAIVSYSMVPTTQSFERGKEYNETFSIDRNFGVVTLKKAIDYEKNNYYQFNVTATDGKYLTSTNLIIRVLDVQDTPPFFTRNSYREMIKEEVPTDSLVVIVNAEDGDRGVPNEIGFNLTSVKCTDLFKINDKGVITTLSRIDRDNTNSVPPSGTCELTVQAFEKNTSMQAQYGNTTATVTVSVDVTDIDDNPPSFNQQTINATVPENTPVNVPITLQTTGLNVTDVDQGQNAIMDLSVQWLNGSDCSDFAAQPVVVSNSAEVVIIVKNSSVLDYEKIQLLEFQVIATGRKNSSLTDRVIVTLNITDVNDNRPVFEKNNTCHSVMENVTNGSYLCTIHAIDVDTTSRGNLRYSITGGNNRLVVNNTTGEIYTNCITNCSIDFDRETYSDIPVSCTVKDEGGRLDYLPLTFKVDDVNDNTPTFYRSEFESFISENDGNYTKIPLVKLAASDNDATSHNSQVTYSLLDEGLAANFTCNSTTGEVFLKSALDYEELTNTTGKVVLTAVVTDKGTPSLSSNATVVVHVQDVNDNFPMFDVSPYHTSVPEDATSNLTARTNVINITAHDDDGTRQNKELHFYIAGGAGDKFAIISTTGQLYVQIQAKLDRETTPQYNITVTAMDQGSPSHTNTTIVTIDVTDVNDEPPRFYPTSFSAKVKENTTVQVINVTANDSDTNYKLRYFFVDSDVTAFDEVGNVVNSSLVKNYFVIDNNTGLISSTTNADRETAERVILTVAVEDTNAVLKKPQIAKAQVEITLLDVNDNYPTFDKPTYNISVIENAPNNSTLLQAHATDRDKNQNQNITYSLAQSNWTNRPFKLDAQKGILTKVGQLDREDKASGVLTITASDNGVPPLTSTATVYVTVDDFNDNAPIFQTPNEKVTCFENATKGSFVLCMHATDRDKGPNSKVTYEISSGGNGTFSINATGCISIANKLDRETIPAYNLILTAFDNPLESNTRKSTTTSLSVVIDDVNDNPPIFAQKQYKEKFPEDKKNGSVVLTIRATDKDMGNNSQLTYKMTDKLVPDGLSNASWPFQINEDSGIIRINGNLKDKVGNYSLVVVATDHGVPSLSGNATVTLEVLDLNLWNPVITNLPRDNTIDVFECVPPGTIFYTFNYTDKDSGVNAYATFNMSDLDSISLSTFSISENGSLKNKIKLDAWINPEYKFQVQATDHGTPALSSDKLTITVKVLDVNDHLPSFDGHNISASIPENTTDVLVTTVTAIDVDKNSNSCYSIANGQWSKHFNVTLHGGEIFIIDDFDYEQTKEVDVVVNVKDCSIDVNTTGLCPNTTFNQTNETQTVNVHIQDVDDNPPKFISTISTGMRRTAEPGTILKIHLRSSSYITDLDSPRNGYLSWKFANGGEIIPSENLKVKINTSDGVNPCGNTSGVHHIFCIDGNGTITSNKLFREDLFGFFKVPVRVYDKAGSDTTTIKVYLIGDTQILMMVVLDEKANVDKDKIFKAYGSITGHTFVYDGIEDHKEGGRVDPTRSDLYFHVVDRDGENVLSAIDAERLVDDNAGALTSVQRIYHISQITSSREVALKESNTSLKFYVAVAIASALALTLIIVSYAGLSTKSKYKQKLRAATIKSIDMSTEMIDGSLAVPGSNQYSRQFNPLLNEKVEATYDKMSLSSNNSIDENAVDASPNQATVYDRMEEREVSLDMYGEDTFQSTMQEDPLDVALRMHEQLKESADQHSAKTDSIVGGNFSKGYDANSEDSDAGNPDGHPKELHFHNHAFDDMESTEI